MEAEELLPIMPLVDYLVAQYEIRLARDAAVTAHVALGGKPEDVDLKKVKPQAAPAEVKAFAAFAAEFLDEFRPQQPTYLDGGIGAILANGQTVSLGNAQELEPMRDEGIHITRPRSVRGQGGMAPTEAVLFGGRR